MALCNLNWNLELTFRTNKVKQINCQLLITCRYSGIYRGGRQGASWEDIRDPGQERWRQSGGGWVHQGGPPRHGRQFPLSLYHAGLPPGQAATGDAQREPHRRGQPGHRRRGLSPGPCNLLLSRETHWEIYIIYRKWHPSSLSHWD